jgi:hypothetical protein
MLVNPRDARRIARYLFGFLCIGGLNRPEMFRSLANDIDAPAGHLTKHLSGPALARWLLFPVGPALDHSFRFDVSDIGVPDKDCDAIPFPHFVVEFCARHTDAPIEERNGMAWAPQHARRDSDLPVCR